MLFPLESQALLLEGRVRRWVAGEYCYRSRVFSSLKIKQMTLQLLDSGRVHHLFPTAVRMRCMFLLSEYGDYWVNTGLSYLGL